MAVGVRRPPGRHKGRYVSKWSSDKTGEVMYTESSLERAQLRLLEWDPAVTYYRSQPFRLIYLDDGRVRRYTPDVVVHTDRRTVIEVKPHTRTLEKEFQRWASVVGNALQERGYTFEVRTEREILLEPRLSNINVLLRYRRQPVAEGVEFAVKRWVREEPGLPLGAVIDRLGGGSEGLCLGYALLMRHAVRYDIHQPVNRELQLYPLNVGGILYDALPNRIR